MPKVRGRSLHIWQIMTMLQISCNTSKADSLVANTSVITVSFIYPCLEDSIMVRRCSYDPYNKQMNPGNLNRVNFREIASFLMFLHCLKTNAKAKKVSFTLERVVRKVGMSEIKNIVKHFVRLFLTSVTFSNLKNGKDTKMPSDFW